MWLRIVVAIGCCIGGAAAAGGEEAASLADRLRAELREAEAHPIALGSPARMASGEDAGERCAEAGDVERGSVGGRRATVWSDGPHGSGHYTRVTIVVELDGRRVGACVTTSTAGWRNLSASGHRLFGRWRVLAGDRVVLWNGLAAGTSEYESLIFALVYRLRGEALVLDRAATLAEIARIGRVYATEGAAAESATAMHRTAAAAYRAGAAGPAR